jgi:hypothetical protein
VRDLGTSPAGGSTFTPVPAPALTPKNYALWSKELAKWLCRTQGIARLKSPKHKLYSQPNEDERSFRARLAQLGREARDAETAEVKEKLASKLATLEERIRKKQDAVARGEDAANEQRMAAAVTAGGGLLGAFLHPTARGVASSAAQAARSANRASNKARNVARDKDDLSALLGKHAELQREAREDLAKIVGEHDPQTLSLESVVTKPKKTGVSVHLVALAWVGRPAQ